MITPQTREMIETASQAVERLFARRGELAPVYFVEHNGGRLDIVPAPPCSKDEAVALMRAYFAIHNVTRYVFVDEAWRVTIPRSPDAAATESFCREHGVSAHPDRVEMILFVAEDELGIINAYRAIMRRGRKSSLGPLEYDPEGGTYEGRMMGLLPARGTKQ
jgi:hypothetical protein